MRKLALGLTALAVACTASVGDLAGDAGEAIADAGRLLEDAGRALSDAGSSIVDAGRDAAQAQAPAVDEVACMPVVQTAVYAGGKQERTWWFAELKVSGTPPIDVVLCDRESFGANVDPWACPNGATCTGTPHPPPARCAAGAAEYDGGIARVYCGYRVRTYDAGGTLASDSGERRKTAFLTVR